MIPLQANLTGGASEANSRGEIGNTGGTAGGGYRGSFINNFAAAGARLDSALDAGAASTPAASNLVLYGSLALGAAALLLSLRRR